MELKGRQKIYTDVDSITDENVIQVLTDSLIKHSIVRQEIEYLLNFDKGVQPLMREKEFRPEIDIKSTLNLANQITEFKLGYVWGNPIALVQKSDKTPKGSNALADNTGIVQLNNMFDSEFKDSADQELARYVEVCGVGFQMIDIKRDAEDGESAFDLDTLNPLYTYIVYSSDVHHRPMLGVTYVKRNNGTRFFTCISDEKVYYVDEQKKIVNGKVKSGKYDYVQGERSGEPNPIGEVYIIEYERSFDRMGCFERQIDELNALNILKSDFVNDVAQAVQAFWWMNDADFALDDDGNLKKPESGGFLLTKTTGNGKAPIIQALVSKLDYAGILQDIQSAHDYILECAFVPKQSDPGGGSTGTAMSLSSGWSAAEAAANKESLVLKKSFQKRNRLALKAIRQSPMKIDESLLNLSPSDIDVRFIRQKTFDMASKVNALSTMLSCMVDPKTAMAAIDFFPNLAEAIDDSIDNMKKYQENLLESGKTDGSEPVERLSADLSDQTENSPILNS